MTKEFNYDFLNAAKENPDNKVIIDYGTNVLTLLLAEDPSITTGNSWESPLEGSIENSLGGVTRAINLGKQFTGTQVNLGNYRETILYYKGSKSLDLRLQCILIATTPDENLNAKIAPLLDLTNSDFDASNDFSFTVKAPLGYSPDPKSSEGKLGIKIGRWFSTPKLYVLESSDTSVSKARLPNGRPLYLNVTLSLKPFRLLSKTEVKKFLI